MESGEGCDEDVAVVQLSEDDQGLAAGQFAAFYQGKTCLGSGVILESWDDKGFPVCAKALEIARIEDKSLLGKPVKIKVKPPLELDQEVGSTELNKEHKSSQIAAAKRGRLALFPPIKWLQQFRDNWFRIF
uniref:tRNA-specific 2-thiouridylase MnmA-like C-terminal domain-containing protein n=2 Tax=Cannabis sativa TaxID=3483 RepID=A0A803R7K1_CANSA